MVKKAIKIFCGVIGGVILLVVAASIVIMLYVDKGLVESQMKKALNRHVQIEKISVGIFSIVSGIEVKNVRISNYKTGKQIEALKGKPVPQNDVFISMDSLRLKARFLPLLKKKFELSQFVLYNPVINVAKGKDGSFNFDDLMKPKKLTPEEKAELAKEKARAAKEPDKPLTADDIPVGITIGEVGIKNGTVNYTNTKLGQKFQVYKLTALASDIKIDPKDLAKKNSVKLKLHLGVKTVGPVKSGSVESFDITLDAAGNAKPFDLKTRRLDPEATFHAGSPEGEITGLQIFNILTGNNILTKYIGDQLSFLKGKQEWKGSKMAYVDVWYKGGVAKLSNGNLNLKEARLLFGGAYNTGTSGLNVDLDLELSEKRNSAVRVGLRKQVESGLKRLGVDKYAKADTIVNAAMKPLLNKNGRVFLRFKVTGTTSKPDARLVHPQLGSLDVIIKQAAGDVLKDTIKEAGKKVIEDKGKDLLKDGGKKLLKLPKKLF